jgi:ABC-type glycerol-3-phosphate transport system substrate-binding protein
MKKFMAMALAVAMTAGVALAGSAAISGTAYDAATKVLTVTFEGGEVYEYADVPQAVVDAMAKAESKGTAFNELVKGKFTAKKVGGEKKAAE